MACGFVGDLNFPGAQTMELPTVLFLLLLPSAPRRAAELLARVWKRWPACAVPKGTEFL